MNGLSLYWQKSKLPVNNEEELLAGLLKIEDEAKQAEIPIAVGLGKDGSGLLFTVGDMTRSIVAYYTPRGFVFTSNGMGDEPYFVYSYLGSYTEIEHERTLPTETVNQAVLEYFKTSVRPSNLPWKYS